MSKPTREDASLFLQLLSIMVNDKDMVKATRWVFDELDKKSYDDFKSKYPKGSEGQRNFETFGGYMETLCTFVNRELISEDLIFDMWGSLIWEKFEPIVHGMRKELEKPRYLENYEVVAKRYPAWAERNPPKV
ncbi:MAG: hypothetical protein ACFE85_12040 [Candidatus Hodarchaeota archaeon]